MKNLRLKIVFPLVCFLLIVASIAPVLAVDYNPGVSVGQWIKYGNFEVTTPADTIITPDWIMIEVVGVSGKEVTLRTTGAYMNGTAIPSEDFTRNIETGYHPYIIAANLNQGDPIFASQVSYTINKTETRTILGTSRSVNILNFTNLAPGVTITYIYDKASGMHLGMEMETIIETAVTYKSSYGIIDTNIFEVQPIPEFQSWMLLPLFITATLLAVIIQKRKHTTQQ